MTTTQLPKGDARFLDLDEAVEERDAIEVQHKGKTYKLPGSVGADVVLKYLRYGETGVIPNSEVQPLFVSLVGQDILDEMLASGLSFKKLEYMVVWLLKEYGIFTGDLPADENDSASEGDSPNA